MIAKLLTGAALMAVLSSAALAADLPDTKGPASFMPPPPPVFSWTGVYIGGQAGYQWGTSDPFFSNKNGTNYSDQGVVGGAHAGFNYQLSQFVFGVEGDVEGSNYSGSAAQTNFFDYTVNSTRINVDGSIRGRLGWAWDRVLLYGTGGAAFASIKNTFYDIGASDSRTFGAIGWTAGGGVEYAIDPNWSVRVEYRYTDYGSYSFPLTNTYGSGVTAREHERDNRVEAGFSYKFDMFAPPAPVVAKY